MNEKHVMHHSSTTPAAAEAAKEELQDKRDKAKRCAVDHLEEIQ